jgi:hypothetical protein
MDSRGLNVTALTAGGATRVKESDQDPRRALVRRVTHSSTFAKSERLSSFLTYVCEMTLSGRSHEINEQKIGTAVFGRAPDYDSTIDGIVRPQASRLRQRLDVYFNGEGANEPLRINLPRGSYVPVFEKRTAAKPLASPTVPDELGPAAVRPDVIKAIAGSTNRKITWVALSILLASILALLLVRGSSRSVERVAASAAHPLWGLMFRSDQETMVVPSDTGLVMWRGVTKQNIDLSGYLRGDYYRSPPAAVSSTPGVNAADLASRRYTSIIDLDVVKALQQIADTRHSRLGLRYARDVRPNDLKNGDVVLVGAAAANPWVELFEPKMDFVFSNARFRQYTVLNRRPKGTEPESWSSDYDDPQKRVYGVVAFLPNLSGTGNVLILEGTSGSGTECAWDFVSDDSSLLPFLNQIKRPDGTVPHFQLVLDSTNLNDSSVKRTILAWRVND